jgi:hypothetical protein
MPDDRHLSTRTRPITAWHSNFATRTHIITLVTLISDKLTPIRAVFSTMDPVHQGPGRSTQE